MKCITRAHLDLLACLVFICLLSRWMYQEVISFQQQTSVQTPVSYIEEKMYKLTCIQDCGMDGNPFDEWQASVRLDCRAGTREQ